MTKNRYKDLEKLLLENGFVFVRFSKHVIFSRNGINVAVSKTIYDPDIILKKCVRKTERNES